MQGYEGVFGVPHPQRGGKKTKWQEAGVEGKMAEVLEEHDVPSAEVPAAKDEVDITLGNDGEDEIQNGRVIALDFDDVCCHNALWGTNMNVFAESSWISAKLTSSDEIETYFYHQNPGWGSLAGQSIR
jgi:hypothetical protein